jgi:hypothetical protein
LPKCITAAISATCALAGNAAPRYADRQARNRFVVAGGPDLRPTASPEPVEGSSVTSPTVVPQAAGMPPAEQRSALVRNGSEAPRERTPSFDEMLDGCILRLIHKLPPTDLAPRRDRH